MGSDGAKRVAGKPIGKPWAWAIIALCALYFTSLFVAGVTVLMSGHFSERAPDSLTGHTYQIVLGQRGGPHYPGYVTPAYGLTMDISSDIFLAITGLILCILVSLAIAKWARRRRPLQS
jgi:hypothetical protein